MKFIYAIATIALAEQQNLLLKKTEKTAVLCDTKYACCNKAGEFCHTTDKNSFCDPSVPADRQFPETGCACPMGTKYDSKTKKCDGEAPPPAPPTPTAGSFCVHNAKENACGKCTKPQDCGGVSWNLCWASKDPQCDAPAPPVSAFCVHDSKKNSCGACTKPQDCGGDSWDLCWAAKDPQCPHEEEVIFAAAPLCDTKYECCNKPSTFCAAADKESFCDPSTSAERQFPETGCACPFGAKYDAKTKKCAGEAPPVPASGFCVHSAKKNSCGACTKPQDCGGDSKDWDLCWAAKDGQCPKEEVVFAAAPLCDTKYECCNKPAIFCAAADKESFCDPTVSADRQFPETGCACPFGAKYDAKTKKCAGEAPPVPASGFCVHSAKKNSCGACTTPQDCGGDSWDLCWAAKDVQCPKKPAFMLKCLCNGVSCCNGTCVHDAKKNACGSCEDPWDCGGDAWHLCWANTPPQCPAAQLVV